MTRNRDLKDIQDGRSRVRQPRFECRQSGRAGVRIYCPFRAHRLKWGAGYRDPAARLAGNPSTYPFIKGYEPQKIREIQDFKIAFLDSRLRRSGTDRPTTARMDGKAKGHDRVHPLRPQNMKRITTGQN